MSLERFCRKDVITMKPDDPVQWAAERMAQNHVGCVVVVNLEGRPVGILTDRDIVCRVVAQRKDPERMQVREAMSPGAGVIRETELIDQALVQMRQLGARRLPVVNDSGAAVGMVTLDDLVVLLSAELGQTAQVIRSNRGP